MWQLLNIVEFEDDIQELTLKHFITLWNIHLRPGGLVDEEPPGEPGKVYVLVLQVLHDNPAGVIYMGEPAFRGK